MWYEVLHPLGWVLTRSLAIGWAGAPFPSFGVASLQC